MSLELEALWSALWNLWTIAEEKSRDEGQCIGCGTRDDKEHDPRCPVWAAKFQIEVYRQKRSAI